MPQPVEQAGTCIWQGQMAPAARPNMVGARFSRCDRGRVRGAIGWGVLACGVTLLALAGARSPHHQMLENTATLERLATKLLRAERLAPETRGSLAQLLRRPDYDCGRSACDASLDRRNADARSTLATLLAKHSGAGAIAARE